MKAQPKHPHLGELIKTRLKELGMSKAEFGRRIGTSRQNVSLILEKESLDTKLLMKIGKELGINLFAPLADAGEFGHVTELTIHFAGQKLKLVALEEGSMSGTTLFDGGNIHSAR